MDTQTLRLFQREVERQCRFGLLSIQLLNGANAAMQMQDAATIPPGPPKDAAIETYMTEIRHYQDRIAALREQNEAHTTQLWYAIQSFLIAAGNLSKLLWGTRAGADATTWAKRVQDRRELRTSLGVGDNSVLKLSPEFRNHFEHMDERVEQWANRASGMAVTDLIGPTAAIGGIDSKDFFRSYDPAAQTLAFRGEVFEIVPVAEAMDRLLPKAAAEASKSPWEDPTPS